MDWPLRVAAADKDAETLWDNLLTAYTNSAAHYEIAAWAQVVIAAELRAARIAQRPADAGREDRQDA